MTNSSSTSEITKSKLLSLIRNLPTDKRSLIAIAGPPASGKTSLANWLVEEFNQTSLYKAQALYMDGFHYDNLLLNEMNLLPRKGSPNTFDVRGLENTLERIVSSPTEDVIVPVFDRGLEIARAGASLIAKDVNLLIVEGNYILCGKPPWNRLNEYFDLKILIKIPGSVLKKRLYKRWEYYGLDDASIQFKIYENDLPNGEFVMEHSQKVDYYLTQS